MVIAVKAELKIGERVVGTLSRGEIRTISQIKNGWYWVRGADSWAWINSRDVIARKEGIRYFSEAIRKSASARDFNIRAGLRTLEGQRDLAMADFNEAIRREPTRAEFFRERALAWSLRGQIDKAIADFGAAIRLDPNNVSQYALRASRWEQKGEYEQAIADYDQVIRLDPQNLRAYADRGRAFVHEGDLDRAIADFDEVIRHDPKEVPDCMVYVDRACAWLTKGDQDRAETDFDEAIRRTSNNPWFREFPFMARANVRLGQRRYGEALADCDEIIRLNAAQAGAYAMAAWALATCPDAHFRDGSKAIEYATKAVELSRWKANPDRPAILAAAYAEAGKFEHAIEWQKKAVELAPESEKEDFRKALALCESNMPIREESRGATSRPRLYFETFVQ